MRRSAALVGLTALTFIIVAVSARPAVAAGPPSLTVKYPQAWPGEGIAVTFSDFQDCAAAGAAGYLLWDGKTTLASGISLLKQPIDVKIGIPPDASLGSHTISASCPSELVSLGYGASVSIEVVPPPDPAIRVAPDPAPPGSSADLTARQLPAACAVGSLAFQLAKNPLAVRVVSRELAAYRNTGATVTNLVGTFTVPLGLSAGRYPITVSCQGVRQSWAAEVGIAAAVDGPTSSPRVPSPSVRASAGTGRQPSASPSQHDTTTDGGGRRLNAAQVLSLGGGLFVAILVGALIAVLIRGRRGRRERRPRPVLVGYAGEVRGPTVTALGTPAAHAISVRHYADSGSHTAKGLPR